MIAFEDLHETSAAELAESGVNLSIPFAEKENLVNIRWNLWKPTLDTTVGSHLLHTEDEVTNTAFSTTGTFRTTSSKTKWFLPLGP